MRTSHLIVAVWLALGVPSAALAQSGDPATYVVFGVTRVVFANQAFVHTGNVGSNGEVRLRRKAGVFAPSEVAADVITAGPEVQLTEPLFYNALDAAANAVISPNVTSPISVPFLTIPPLPAFTTGTTDVVVPPGGAEVVSAGKYDLIRAGPRPCVLTFEGGVVEVARLLLRGRSGVSCQDPAGCIVRVSDTMRLKAKNIDPNGNPLTFEYAGSRSVVVGYRKGAYVEANVIAPFARVRFSSGRDIYNGSFVGRMVGNDVRIGFDAFLRLPVCGDGLRSGSEQCDPPQDSSCPGQCLADCSCPAP